jgi:hypothetical protein
MGSRVVAVMLVTATAAIAVVIAACAVEFIDQPLAGDASTDDDASVRDGAHGFDALYFSDVFGAPDSGDGGSSDEAAVDAGIDVGIDSNVPPCQGKPDGYNWLPGDDTARCCGGQEVHTNTDQNCGVCGIKCNPTGNDPTQSCQQLGGHWFCRGCTANSYCWSSCCSTSFSPYNCAASDCAGNCISTCPNGSHCVLGGGTSSNYCSY